MITDIMTTDTLVAIDCYKCGVWFGVPESLRQRRLDDKRNFWCPNGHEQHYMGKTEAQKERERAEQLGRQLEYARAGRRAAQDQAQAAERRRAAAKGQLTKIRNRIANGVCPCCNRSFENVRDHMATQHPDFAAPPEVSS